MNEKVEEILELPLPLRLAIVGTAVVLIVLLYYFVYYAPIGEKMTETKNRIDALKIEIDKKVVMAENLPKFEAEVERLNVELNKALRELPDKKEIDSLLARISDRARDAGLEIRLFQPQAEQLKDFYAEVPVQIEVGGTYHQVASFFDEVAHLERIVNVDQFSMKDPKTADEGLLLNTSALATSFRFLDESERPKVEGGKKKGRKRKRSAAKDQE